MSTQNPSSVLNLFTTDPSLRDVLVALKKEILLQLSCHHVGKITAFNPENQTAQAEIVYTKTYFQLQNGNYVATNPKYTLVLSAPVVCLGGGDASLTFPIAVGDECLVLFNDRDMDNWLQTGSTTNAPATSRLHSFSDGIILVGIRSLPNVLSNYDTTRAVLQNGNAMVGVGPSLIKIANETTDLKTVLTKFVAALNQFATACELSLTDSVLVDAAKALVTALGGSPSVVSPPIATQIGEILE